MRLALPIFSIASTTLMGIGVIVVLTTGYDTLQPIVAAAAVGFVAAIPVTWAVVRAITRG